jgi:hypothetical protein
MNAKGLRHLRVGRKFEAEPGQSAPSQRALDALAEAVRRAREATAAAGAGEPASAASRHPRPAGPAGTEPSRGVTAQRPGPVGNDDATPRWVLTDREPPLLYTSAARPAPSEGGAGSPSLHPGRQTLRRVAPLAMLGAVLLAAAILVLSVGGGSGSSRPTGTARARPGITARPRTSRPSVATSPTSRPPSTRPRPAPTQSTTTVPATVPTTTVTTLPAGLTTAGAAPQLSSITPSQGSAGTVVVVHGTSLFSPNGLVLARFDGQPTHTICPTQTSCKVTVPPLPGSPLTVRVTIATESGTSNALSFLYR